MIDGGNHSFDHDLGDSAEELLVRGGSVDLAAPQRLGSLSIAGGRVTQSLGVLRTSNLQITGKGMLDLRNGEMIVDGSETIATDALHRLMNAAVAEGRIIAGGLSEPEH